MLTSIHIQGFKNFKDTQITPLRKVNLILGGQNVGKTSLLEAVYLGASPNGNVASLPVVFRLAEGHDSPRFFEMTFKGVEGLIQLGLDCEIETEPIYQRIKGISNMQPAVLVTALNPSKKNTLTPSLFADMEVGGLRYSKQIRPSSDSAPPNDLFNSPLAISVNPPNQLEAVRLLDRVVLKRKKRTLLDALRRIEPRLEDMHSLSPDGEQRVYLELDGLPTAVPLPQLGHGFSRLLYLYCSLLVTDAKLALVDEVENGIHYASLPILFKGVQDMAATQGVQTLMTTHSWDCIRAAYKTFADAGCLQDFQLIRLEREGDNVRAVVINDDMLDTVMEAGYEVR